MCTVSQGDHAWSPLVTWQCTSRGNVPRWLHYPPLQWKWRSHQRWCSTTYPCHRRRLVLWSPRVPCQILGPFSSLCWVEHVEREEAEEAVPADIPLESSTDGQGLPSMPDDQSADFRPPLRRLDVAQAVGHVCPGHLGHITSTLLQAHSADLGPNELAARVSWMLTLRQDVASFIRKRIMQAYMARRSPV